MTTRTERAGRQPIETIALALAVAAVVPYTTLKVLWIAGYTVGLETGAVAAEMASPRMVAGNAVTIVLEIAAVGLAVALARPWGRRLPAWMVFVLAGGATGLLAPILLGLPLGSLLQLAVHGQVRTGGMDHLSPWVFALVYGGFGLLAVAIAVLAGRYVLLRWGGLLSRPPRPPAAWSIVAGTLGMLPFGAAMLWWGLAGPGTNGPQAMESIAQRTVLVVTGLLTLSAFAAPLLSTHAARRPRAAWLLTWVGCTTAALQGPTAVLLANGGSPTPAVTLLALLAPAGSASYGLALLRRRVIETRTVEARQQLGTVRTATSGAALTQAPTQASAHAGRPVTAVAAVMAAGCLAFAAVNVSFEVTDRFGYGPPADYASGLTVVNWLVIVLKVVGAAVALLSVSRRPSPVPPLLLGVALWGVFATLGVYGLGSVLQAVGMVTGVAGSVEDIDLAGVGYVLGFLSAAAGFGVLAVSHARRHRLPRRAVVLGALVAPVTLGLVLLAVPALLVALGVMPGS